MGKFRSLDNYNAYRKANSDWPSDPRDLRCNDIETGDWEAFVRDSVGTRMLAATGYITSNPPPVFTGSSGSSSRRLTPVESFKRSIKRDSNQFTNLKEGKYWCNWRSKTLATNRAQDADEVIDPNYMPSSQDNVELFEEKQKFVCSVFSTNLKTDRAKKFV